MKIELSPVERWGFFYGGNLGRLKLRRCPLLDSRRSWVRREFSAIGLESGRPREIHAVGRRRSIVLDATPRLGRGFTQPKLQLDLGEGVEGLAGGEAIAPERFAFFFCGVESDVAFGLLGPQQELVTQLCLHQHRQLTMLELGRTDVVAGVEPLDEVVPANRHDQQQALLVLEPGLEPLLPEDLEQGEPTCLRLLSDVAEDDVLQRLLAHHLLVDVEPEGLAELRRQHLSEDLAAGLDALLELLGLVLAVLALDLAALLERNDHFS